MRIMIDILHPAHVHFFKNFYFEMRERGHEFLVTSRDKESATSLLERHDIPYTLISRSSQGSVRQATEFVRRSLLFGRLARRFQPDVLTGIMGPTIATIGKLLSVPCYVFYDTEFAQTTNRFVYPWSTRVVTPDCYTGAVGSNHLTYPGYHELAYLHPKRFTPDPEKVRQAGIDPDEPYVVVRFVGWWATHDRGEKGLTAENKVKLVEKLAKHGRVVLSSEAEVPPELKQYVYRGPVESIHHVLAYASLLYGESATMASEAAVLGTPAIYIATTSRGYTDDQAGYGLVHRFQDDEFTPSLKKALDLFSRAGEVSQTAVTQREKMLARKIDVTQFMVDLFENDFPHTVQQEPVRDTRSA